MLHKNFFGTLTILLVAICITSCKKDNGGPTEGTPTATRPIYPLKAGNSWVFRNVGSTTSATVTISSLTTINGRQVFQFIGDDDFYFDFNGTNSGLFYQGDDLWGMKAGAERLLIPQSRAIGTSTTPHSGNYDDTLSVLSTNDQIAVPAGTFQCYKYKWRISSSKSWNIWMADGVGIVKMEGVTGGAFTTELLSYMN